MEMKPNQIHRLVEAGIENGTSLSVAELRKLRNLSEQKVKTFKTSFWIAVVLLNLLIWVPFPFEIPLSVKVSIGILCLCYALSVPIVMIRKHQQRLESLKLAPQGPKRRSAADAGQHYIDRVRTEGRSFIQAEFDLLAGSKYSNGNP